MLALSLNSNSNLSTRAIQRLAWSADVLNSTD